MRSGILTISKKQKEREETLWKEIENDYLENDRHRCIVKWKTAFDTMYLAFLLPCLRELYGIHDHVFE